MYCNKCGNEIADGARFCSFCGSPVEAISETPGSVQPTIENNAVEKSIEGMEKHRRIVHDDINWNTQDYPDSRKDVYKSEDIDFDWNSNPNEISEPTPRENIFDAPAFERTGGAVAEDISAGEGRAAERIDKFYTFSQPTESFRQMLDKEYDKIKNGNPIESESQFARDEARRIFDEKPKHATMEEFMESEGIVDTYKAKAFESDVLERIEAQERAKEAKRLEEEARLKAMEEARLEAEAKKREEAERLREEEARLRAAEEAKRQEEERILAEARRIAEARQAEEKRLEEERLAAEEKRLKEESLRREAEAKKAAEAAKRAAEEEARIKAAEEAHRKMVEQEAAKLEAQRQASKAAAEEEKRKVEVARRLADEKILQDRMKREKEAIAVEEESAVAEAEARKVLEHTARMRAEEAEKIRAAVAGLKNKSLFPEEQQEAPVQKAVVEEVKPAAKPVEKTKPAEIKREAAPAARPREERPSFSQPARPTKTVEELLDEQAAKPIDPIFAEQFGKVGEKAPQASQAVETERPTDNSDIRAAVKAANNKAHAMTRETLTEMAKARAEFIADFDNGAKNSAPMTVEDLFNEKPVTGRDTMLSADNELADTRTIDKEEILAGIDHTIRISKAELAAATRNEAPAEEPKKEEVDDNQAEANLVQPVVSEPAKEPDLVPPVKSMVDPEDELAELVEGFVKKEEPTVQPIVNSQEEDKPGLDNTMVVTNAPVEDKNMAANDFDNYGEREAEELRRKQEEANADVEVPKDKKAKKAKKSKANKQELDEALEESKDKGGAGRIVLKILLILLIVIFAAELAGIGIKYLAPNSKAAEVIDNQLNRVIQLITGDVEDGYQISGIDYKI